MKSIFIVSIAAVLALFLTACVSAVAVEAGAPTFKAYVSEVYETEALVIVTESQGTLAPNSMVYVNYESSGDLEVGDLVEFSFTGQVMLSEPAQVNSKGWKVLQKNAERPEADMGFEVYSGEMVFRGTIIDIRDISVLVQVTEGDEVLASADQVAFTTEGLEDIGAEVGSEVIVTITGAIAETYPAQVNPFSWELAE